MTRVEGRPAELASTRSDRLMRALFEGVADGIVLYDDEARIVDANPAACALLGRSSAELRGRPVLDGASAGDRSAALRDLLAGGGRGSVEVRRPDGTARFVDCVASPNVAPGIHAAVLRDDTERRRTDEALRWTATQLQTVVLNAPLVVFAFDTDGIYTLHEGSGVVALGLRPGELVGTSVFARFAQVPAALDAIRTALAGRTSRWEGSLGSAAFQTIFLPLRDATGAVTGVTGVALDVAAKKRAQDALRAREARFRAMVEKSDDGVALLSADATPTYQTPATARILGYSDEEVTRMPWRDLVLAEDHAKVQDALAHLLATPGGSVPMELRIRHRDGAVRWIDLTVTNLLDDAAVEALVVNLRDVTARKVAEQALVESQAILEEAQAVAHVGSWSRTEDGQIAWSKECARIFGKEASDRTTSADILASIHPDDRSRVAVDVERTLNETGRVESEHRIVLPDGSVRWVFARATLHRDVAGRPPRVVGVVQDVTERRRATDELLVSEQRYRRIVESTSEGIWIYTRDGKTTFMNARMAEMLGVGFADAAGVPVLDFVEEASRVSARARMDRRMRGIGESSEFRFRRRDGSELWAQVQADPIYDAAGEVECVLAIVSDMTDRRRADEARNRLAAIVESSEDAILSTDLSGDVTTWNRGAEHLFGFTADEILGSSVSILIPPEWADREHEILESIRRGASVRRFETTRRRRDGTLVDVSLVVSPIRDAEGRIIGASEIARDLSEQRKAGALLRAAEDQLRQAQKMEAIGSLAGGVAHDFNNLLSVILSYTGLALDELPPNEPLRDDIQEIERAGRKAADLTRQLLAFSRQQVLEPQVVDVKSSLRSLEKMLVRLLGANVSLALLLEAPVGHVYADPGQLEQVILNLVVNARDAMPDGGSLVIEAANIELDEAYAARAHDVVPGSYVMLAVSDTGIGMDDATRARIFEPFFTTKELGKGTGLGLSTVYGIVKQSGGHVVVESEPGNGATFRVYFPRSREADSTSVAPPMPTLTLRGEETILLVEDEEAVRATLRAILRKQGYTVLEAQNGGEAFLICEQHEGRIHLLLSDIVMPRMNGPQLASRLAPLRPDMKLLYVSGYAESAVQGTLTPGSSFLQKPFTPLSVARKVREVLDAVALTAPRLPDVR